MKTADNLLILNTKDRLRIEWRDLPFNLNISVLWRGLYLPIHIEAFRIELGSSVQVTFNHNGKEYPCKSTKWKNMGGSNGIYPPKIETLTHFIKVEIRGNSLELIDKIKDPLSAREETEQTFLILYQS